MAKIGVSELFVVKSSSVAITVEVEDWLSGVSARDEVFVEFGTTVIRVVGRGEVVADTAQAATATTKTEHSVKGRPTACHLKASTLCRNCATTGPPCLAFRYIKPPNELGENNTGDCACSGGARSNSR